MSGAGTLELSLKAVRDEGIISVVCPAVGAVQIICIISRSSLSFSIKFQLTQSSTRPNSYTSRQSSPNNTTGFQTALA
jgi:hypothetical protein